MTGTLKMAICSLFVILNSVFGILPLMAQEDNAPAALSKQILEAKTSQDLYAPFAVLKDYYFKNNLYSEFVDYLKLLRGKNKEIEPFINAYTALARYQHLKYLEEKQLWDEYFSQGNNYRDELTQGAKAAIDATSTRDGLHALASLVLWQFHKDQQDAFAEDALSALMNSVSDYAASGQDTLLMKEIADKLLAYGEKGKSRELYKAYAQKIITSQTKDETLADIASGFYKEGNLDLAENIYDAYVERIAKSAPKEKLAFILTDIAKVFAYKDEGANDPVYAEKMFKKLEEAAGKDIFDQELIYLRGFNLEKSKEYPKAKEIYLGLVARFPESSHNDEAVFKAGLIAAYVLRDIKQAKANFLKLTQREKNFSPQSISSFYQLGLLSQWEEDATGARDYYNKLLAAAADNFPETVGLARERLKEIEEARPLEHNLKTFLDLSLKEENSSFDMAKLDLHSKPYRARNAQDVSIASTAYTAPTGCMQVELQYLWSGHLGKNIPTASQPAFDTAYSSPGTKEVNLVVVSPAGIIDRSLDIVDVD